MFCRICGATLRDDSNFCHSCGSSACNPYATDPPVIVDSAGHYYGRLTLNQYHGEIGAGRNYVEWLKEKVCS